jgi:hypothetical protein
LWSGIGAGLEDEAKESVVNEFQGPRLLAHQVNVSTTIKLQTFVSKVNQKHTLHNDNLTLTMIRYSSLSFSKTIF